LGTSPQEYTPAILLDDFNVYDVQDDRWSRAPDFPGDPREAAVAFALNGKGYLGFGKGPETTELSDFYEFDPAGNAGQGSWRPVSPLGFALSTDDIRADEGGRREAVSFVIDGERAFVGLGKNGVNFLNDLWEFIPPVDENDPGEWRLVGFLPDQREGREGAVAFSIDGKAYIGTGGQNTLFEYYNDFWEFDPDTGVFRQREPLPGARWQAVAFTIGDRAFAGAGQFRFRVQRAAEIDTFNDIWEYIPEE
jgi:N-acetylneuraminic acid mutarotase